MSARTGAWILCVGLLPLVLVGAFATVTVYGAVFGIPVLLLVGRPWWAAVRGIRRGPTHGANAKVHTVVAILVIAVISVGALIYGFNDLELGPDAGLVVVGAALLVLLAIATYALYSPPPSIGHAD